MIELAKTAAGQERIRAANDRADHAIAERMESQLEPNAMAQEEERSVQPPQEEVLVFIPMTADEIQPDIGADLPMPPPRHDGGEALRENQEDAVWDAILEN